MTDSRRQNTRRINRVQFSFINHTHHITDFDVSDFSESESPETGVSPAQGPAENCPQGSSDRASPAVTARCLAVRELFCVNASPLPFLCDSAETSGNQVNREKAMPLKPVCIEIDDKNTEPSVLPHDVDMSSSSMEMSGIDNAACSETPGPVFCGLVMKQGQKPSRAGDSRGKASLRADIPDDTGTRTSLTDRNPVQMEQCVSFDHDMDLGAQRQNQPEGARDVDRNDFMDSESIEAKPFVSLQDRAATSDLARVCIPTTPVKIFQDVGALGAPYESGSLPSGISRRNAVQMDILSGHHATTEDSMPKVSCFRSEEREKGKLASLNPRTQHRSYSGPPFINQSKRPFYRRVRNGMSKHSAKRRLKFEDLSLLLASLQLERTDTNKSDRESVSKAHGMSSDMEHNEAGIPIPPQGLGQKSSDVSMRSVWEMSMKTDQPMTRQESPLTGQNRTPIQTPSPLRPGESINHGHIHLPSKKGKSPFPNARRRLEFDHLPSARALRQAESLPPKKGDWQSDVCGSLMHNTNLLAPVEQGKHQTVGKSRSRGQDAEATAQSADRMLPTCVLKSPEASECLNTRSFWRNLRLDCGSVVRLLRHDICPLKPLLEENGRFVESVTICSSLPTTNLQIPRFAEHLSRFCHNIKELTINFSSFEEELLQQLVQANKLQVLKVLKMFVRSFTSLLNCIMSSADLQELEIHLGDEIEVDMDTDNVENFLVTLGQFLARNPSLLTVKFLFPASAGVVKCVLSNCPNLTRLELNISKIKKSVMSGAFDVPHLTLKTLVIYSKRKPGQSLKWKVSQTCPSLQELQVVNYKKRLSAFSMGS